MRRSISPASDIRAVVLLHRLIRDGHYDIVHLHSSKAGAVGRAAAAFWLGRKERPKVVYTPNGFAFLIPGPPTRRAFYTLVECLLGAATDRLIVISEDERQEATMRRVISAQRTSLVRSGVTLKLLDERAGDAKREELGWGPRGQATVIGTVARLTLQKDPFTWLNAAAAAALADPSLHFVWIGGGELERAFLARVHDLGLDRSPQFQYLGHRNDARTLIAAMDVFSISSVFEAGLPYVLMEAMALRRAIVATAASGSRELIQDGHNGLLVPTGDAIRLAAGMLRLGHDPVLRYQLGERARELIVDRCTTTRQVEETRRVYKELSARAGAATG
jgi:glycosyltransferase involved in cell wall biosynthesis